MKGNNMGLKSVENGGFIKIERTVLYKMVLAILVAPNIIFCIGWMRLSVAILCCIAMFLAIYFAYKTLDKSVEQGYASAGIENEVGNDWGGGWITRIQLVFLILCITLIVALSGIGGFGVQSFDWDMRNAIFRDFIEMNWPVIYPYSDRGLCYYLAYFLPAAVIGKIAGLFLNNEMSWLIGNIALMIWTVINLSTMLILILSNTKISWKNLSITLCVFLTFGGLAIVGYKTGTIFGTNPGGDLDTLLIEHYAGKITVANSNFTQLGNVFNQSVPAWLATCLFIKTKDKYCIFGVIVFSLVLTSPFPMVGLSILMLLSLCELMMKRIKLKMVDIFSLSNIFSLAFIIIGFLYYSGNSSVNIHYNDNMLNYGIGQAILLIGWISFLNFFCYCLIIKRRKDMVLWGGALFVPITYFILVGESIDFSMRVTIPYYFMIMIYVIDDLINNNNNRKQYLTILLTISAITPFLTICNVFIGARERGTLIAPYDNSYTFRNKMNRADCNYLSQYTKPRVGEDFFFGKLCKVPIIKPRYPLVTLDVDNNEKFYISEVTVTSDSVEDFLSLIPYEYQEMVLNLYNNEVQYGSEKIRLFLNKYKISWKNNMEFPEEPNKDIDLVWENKKDKYKAGEYIHAEISINNRSDIVVKPVVVQPNYNEKENIISLMCVERDGEKDVHQLGYNLVNNPIYAQEERESTIYFQMPKNRGHYKIQIVLCLFDNVSQSRFNISNTYEYEFDVY